ncbi:HOMEODOMAIN-LIKE SUPERFAMILY PROTEIN [Salix purpurea]|uniref:HOMEODOMAIN-LIKE SUPERFAMILY PROTEIN n=1 Tax=Salix purpurea TaxID=77065 RepID=A0A9Q0PPN3_SALPP|nr:HOMEODOMAIN-LIKE SUPERFAMILY PROTEIN [Salix purpurea]
MKSELADQIGLTEKQISSWFCHRRLKDKRLRDEGCTNGRQDRSSGIIQDRGSGLRQDSCGSTKQGDYRNLDPREVESQRPYGQNFHTADLTYDRTSRYTGHDSSIDNISSGSSSSLQDKFVSQREDPYDAENSKYLAQNEAAMPLIPKGADSFGYKPSGYLKVKGEIENAAITAVKMQLGRHYKEDGPPLGVEFQPLPPGAFASPSRDPANGPIYVGDLARMCSPDVSGVRKQSSLGTRYEVYGTKMSSHDSYTEGANCNPEHSDSHDKKSHHHLEQKPTYNGSNSNAGGNSAMDMPDDLAGETSAYVNKRHYRMSSKHGFEGRRLDSLSTHHGPSGRRNSEKTEAWLYDCNNDNPKIVQRNNYMSKHPHLMRGFGKSLDTEERAPRTITEKEDKLYGEMKRMKAFHDPVRVRRHPTDESTVAKRFRVDFPQQEYVAKASFSERHRRTNLTKGSAMERPSSFSEDEAAETSSSAE